MRRHIVITFLSAASLMVGCGDDSSGSAADKVDSDEQQMTLDPDGDGVAEGQQEGDRASMEFALSDPLPVIAESQRGREWSFRTFDATEDAALMSITDALEITVSSPRTGVTTALTTDGRLVAAPAGAPGEWSVTLSEDRTVLSIGWYNQTLSGLQMEPGQTYDVVYSLGENCCLETVSDTAFPFVLGG